MKYCGIEVSQYKIKITHKKALEKLHELSSKQFERLRDYSKALVKFNCGSTTIICVDQIGTSITLTFQRFYVSF